MALRIWFRGLWLLLALASTWGLFHMLMGLGRKTGAMLLSLLPGGEPLVLDSSLTHGWVVFTFASCVAFTAWGAVLTVQQPEREAVSRWREALVPTSWWRALAKSFLMGMAPVVLVLCSQAVVGSFDMARQLVRGVATGRSVFELVMLWVWLFLLVYLLRGIRKAMERRDELPGRSLPREPLSEGPSQQESPHAG